MNAFVLDYLEKPYKLCKADNCAMLFKVKSNGPSTLILLTKQCPHKEVYRITLGTTSKLDFTDRQPNPPITVNTPFINLNEYTEFLVTWFGGIIRVGTVGRQPFIEYFENNTERPIVGFIKFITICAPNTSHWIFESSPVSFIPKTIKIVGGQLKWMPMIAGNRLPLNAMIGGHENEPIYIARAQHQRSLCPGKYVPSKTNAYVPWGYREHCKDNFEILCGFDAQWVKCESKNIPENAFIAGTSEVANEPLYIGRAMVEQNLVCGKVHLLYNTCYLPYQGREVERYSYEILVSSSIIPRAVKTYEKCYV